MLNQVSWLRYVTVPRDGDFAVVDPLVRTHANLDRFFTYTVGIEEAGHRAKQYSSAYHVPPIKI